MTNKQKVQSHDQPLALNYPVEEGAEEIRNSQNEGVLPPQSVLVGGRLRQFVEGWKRLTNDHFVISIVSNFVPIIRSPQGPKKVQGTREQIFLLLQKNMITEMPQDSPGFYSNVFLVCKASGGWHTITDLKQLNVYAPHFLMHTIRSVLSTVEKRRLRVQNRSAGCLLSCTLKTRYISSE